MRPKRQMIRPISYWAAVALIALSIAGCEASRAVPFEGRGTLDGKPLANATVMLSPTRANGPGPFLGTTDSDGRFVLGAVDDPGGGVVPGEYMVIITTVKSDPNAIEGGPPVQPSQTEIVPSQWRNGSQRFEVPAEGTKEAVFSMSTR